MITIEFDKDMLHSIENKLGNLKSKAPDVLKYAVNDTAKQMRVRLKQEAKKSYTVKAGKFTKEMTISKATNARIYAVIKAVGKPIPLINFKVAEGNSVRAKVVRSNKLKALTLPNADNGKDLKSFVATMSNGHKGVFQRVPGCKMKGKGSRTLKSGRVTKGKQAIKQFYGNSIPVMMSEDRVYGIVEAEMQDSLKKFVAKRMKILMEG